MLKRLRCPGNQPGFVWVEAAPLHVLRSSRRFFPLFGQVVRTAGNVLTHSRLRPAVQRFGAVNLVATFLR